MECASKIVLYVEDDPDDREFLEHAFAEMAQPVEFISSANGLEALQALRRRLESGSPLPSLIVLDINMPFLDGQQTFERLRRDPEFSHIPVVVFTSSENPNDRAAFQQLGVEFITKPDNLAFMKDIAGFMLEQCG